MNFFRSLKKFITYLRTEDDIISYENEYDESFDVDIENPYVSQVRDWAVNKIDLLHESDRHLNAKALAEEFAEWIDISEDSGELEYLCIENNDWTEDQEIDVR